MRVDESRGISKHVSPACALCIAFQNIIILQIQQFNFLKSTIKVKAKYINCEIIIK